MTPDLEAPIRGLRRGCGGGLPSLFAAGLESNEFCVWAVSGPITEEDAKKLLYGFRLIDSMMKGDSRRGAKQLAWRAMSREADHGNSWRAFES